jgi:hypothetical protein
VCHVNKLRSGTNIFVKKISYMNTMTSQLGQEFDILSNNESVELFIKSHDPLIVNYLALFEED